MTVGELRKVLEGLNPGMEVGVEDHDGDLVEFDCLPKVEQVEYHDRVPFVKWPSDGPQPKKRLPRPCLLFPPICVGHEDEE